jgi:O-antigen ligase
MFPGFRKTEDVAVRLILFVDTLGQRRHQTQGGIGPQRHDLTFETFRCNEIIVVLQSDKLALRRRNTGIVPRRDAFVARESDPAQPRITSQFSQGVGREPRSIVDQHQFEISEGLLQRARERRPQERRVAMKHHEHGNRRHVPASKDPITSGASIARSAFENLAPADGSALFHSRFTRTSIFRLVCAAQQCHELGTVMMSLAPGWRTRLFATAGAVLAVALGVQIAHEAMFWPAVCAAALATLIVISIQPYSLTTLLLAGAFIGYIVGNRGFAQISAAGGFPILPGEFVLLVGGAILVVQCAWRRELPVSRDAVNITLLIWMAVGTSRLFFCVREHGFTALRDYAVVYYGLFFFLAQYVARDPAAARLLQRSVLLACAALLVVHPLFSQFQEFFVSTLAIRGFPLIYFKDDLAGNFMAMGSLLFFVRFEEKRRLVWLVLSLALAGLMLLTNSRSSMVGLAVGALWLGLSGRWRFAATLAAAAVVTAVILVFLAEIQGESWRQTPLHRVYERVMSIADPLGQRVYQTEDAFKGDNNVFRMVWWRAAIEETIDTNPWFGLGFGHDLAGRFVRQYLPEATEDFTARSPHNVLVTIFARMGIVGFASFLALISAIALRTWRALRDPDIAFTSGAWWAATWVILVCACFGVVLEGPMGAVVFWTLLGLASARLNQTSESPTSTITNEPAADRNLQRTASAVKCGS